MSAVFFFASEKIQRCMLNIEFFGIGNGITLCAVWMRDGLFSPNEKLRYSDRRVDEENLQRARLRAAG